MCAPDHNGQPGRCPTSYPAPINLGATFNMPLVHAMAVQISDEARALWSQGTKGFDNVRVLGLDLWAPNINIFRDPRWCVRRSCQ